MEYERPFLHDDVFRICLECAEIRTSEVLSHNSKKRCFQNVQKETYIMRFEIINISSSGTEDIVPLREQ